MTQSSKTTIASMPHVPSATLVDVRVVAAMLSCSERNVRRLYEFRLMPAPVKVGGMVRWNRETIEGWIRAGCPREDPRQHGL